MSDYRLDAIRADLEAIRTAADHALVTLAGLGAGFGPAPGVQRPPQDRWDDAVARVRDVLPGDLLPKLTIVDQGSGLVTVKSVWLPRPDWQRLDEKVKSMGGTWIPDGKNSRWEVHVP